MPQGIPVGIHTYDWPVKFVRVPAAFAILGGLLFIWAPEAEVLGCALLGTALT
jgi:hypothetical protein